MSGESMLLRVCDLIVRLAVLEKELGIDLSVERATVRELVSEYEGTVCQKRPSSRNDSQVYAFRCGHAIKIGRTAMGISARRSALQTGSPTRITVLGVWPGGNDEERDAHGALADWRINGEWFSATDEVLGYVATHSTADPAELEAWNLEAAR